MIFDGGFDLGLGPRPLANFQVPLAPSLIHRNEIFARQQKLHDGMQKTFLFLSTLIPVREIEGAFVPQNAQRLPGAVEFEWLHLTKAAEIGRASCRAEGSSGWAACVRRRTQ